MEAYKVVSIDELSIIKLKVENDMLVATISDGRIVSIPVVWFPRLRGVSREKLNHFEISPSGYGIHWPEIDEDISIKAFLP